MNNKLFKQELETNTKIIAIAQMLLLAAKEVSNYQTYQLVYGAITDMDKERKKKANDTIEYCVEKLLELQVNIEDLIN